jgi:predicted RNA-binding protein with PIN domain
MTGQLVFDGFNVFHRWEETSGFFRASADMPAAVDRAMRTFAAFMPRAVVSRALVVLDGGLKAGRSRMAGVRVLHSGPKPTADDEILDLVRASRRASALCIVTTDRALGGNVRALGGRVMSVESFLDAIEREAGEAPEHPLADTEGLGLSPREVEDWLEVFGDGSDILAEEL